MKDIKPINNEDDIRRESLANAPSVQNPGIEENDHVSPKYSNTPSHQPTDSKPRFAGKESLNPRDLTRGDVKKLKLIAILNITIALTAAISGFLPQGYDTGYPKGVLFIAPVSMLLGLGLLAQNRVAYFIAFSGSIFLGLLFLPLIPFALFFLVFYPNILILVSVCLLLVYPYLTLFVFYKIGMLKLFGFKLTK